MFWKKKAKEEERAVPPSFPRYVVEKVAPRGKAARESLVRLFGIAFRRGDSTLPYERMLLAHGLEDAMMASLTLALALEDAEGRSLDDVEYGDCYLCAIFCLAAGLRETTEASIGAMEEWGSAFDEHVDYLVFGDKDSLDDLTPAGWERFLHYHDHPDAILPRAYLHLLGKVIRMRGMGSATPYADLDPMVQPNPIVSASLEQAW